MSENLRAYEVINEILNKSKRPLDSAAIKAEILKHPEFIDVKYHFEAEEEGGEYDEDDDEKYRFLIGQYLDTAIENGDPHAFDFFREVFYEDFTFFLPGLGGYMSIIYAFELVGLHSLYELELKNFFQKKYSMRVGFISNLFFRALLDSPLVMMGETGTGKELLGKVVHTLSYRRKKPYQEINCAAIPEKMLESELFGYEQGAFTDAKKRKLGLLEIADGGTIFLDEIGNMPRQLQAKILRVLEEKKFFRLGGNTSIQIDVRFTAAIQPRNKSEILPDLLYRLGYPDVITMPTLNEALEEAGEVIIKKALERVLKTTIIKETYFPVHSREATVHSLYNKLYRYPTKISKQSLHILMNHKYEGNYRELENILRGAIASYYFSSRNYISPEDLHFIKGTSENQRKIDEGNETEPVSINNKIKLTNIINYADKIRSSIVEKKVIEVLRHGVDVKSAFIAEGLPEKEYQNFWKKITKITGKSIRELNKIALNYSKS